MKRLDRGANLEGESPPREVRLLKRWLKIVLRIGQKAQEKRLASTDIVLKQFEYRSCRLGEVTHPDDGSY